MIQRDWMIRKMLVSMSHTRLDSPIRISNVRRRVSFHFDSNASNIFPC